MHLINVFKKRSGTVLKLSRGLGVNPVSFVLRYSWLAKLREFSEAEILSLGLMDPSLSIGELRQYISKKRARAVYRALNASAEARELIDDKDLFHKTCDKNGLQAAPIVARLTRTDLDQIEAGAINGQLEALEELLRSVPEQFVVKPSLGYHGDGILFLRKTGIHTVSKWDGEPLSPTALIELLRTSLSAPTMPLAQGTGPAEKRRSADKHVLLFQPMLSAHEQLQRLTGRQQVQSLRICTTVDNGGVARIHFVFLKLLAGSNMQDNFAQGTNGNMVAYIEQHSGRIHRVIGRDVESGLMRVTDQHPDTRIPFKGFTLPFWKEACELALRTAACFSGTRAVGWDIGLAPDGPLLLEGNGTWDPLAPLYEPFPPHRVLNSDTVPQTGTVG